MRHKRYAAASSYLQDQRRHIHLTHERLAVRLGIPAATLRSYISGWSAPRPNDPVWERLRDIFGEQAANQYLHLVTEARYDSSDSKPPSSLRLVRTQIHRGRALEARELLDMTLKHRGDVPPDVMVELGRALLDRQHIAKGIESYAQAMEIARIRAERSAPFGILEELATRLVRLEAYADAIDLLRSELQTVPSHGKLWRRLGLTYWYADQLVDAYSALSAAEAHAVALPRVAHGRGQVLAEMGSYEHAITDLEVAIEEPLSLISQAYARSTRAYAFFFADRQAEANDEFNIVRQITPENAWMYWYRARCVEELGDALSAAELFRLSLNSRVPSLNANKRLYAQRFLQRYNSE